MEDAYLKTSLKSLQSKEKVKLTGKDIAEGLVRGLLGTPKEITLSEEEIFQLSLHETGHAYLARKLREPVQLVCILPHGYSGGKTLSIHPEDYPQYLCHMKNRLIFGYGGLVVAEMFGFRDYGGQQSDLEQISELASALVLEHGEGKSSQNIYLGEDKLENFSEELKAKYEQDTFYLMNSAYEKAQHLLNKFGKDKIEYVARKIMQKQMVFQKGLDKIIKEAEDQ